MRNATCPAAWIPCRIWWTRSVIVDTGSSDATRAAALRYTHRVYDFTWRDDFAAARNFAFDQGTMDYLMWLDADDVLERPTRERSAGKRRVWTRR